MFGQAARIIEEAHQHGLLTVIWMYPRGRAVADKDENNVHLIAGGAGVALCLGADFVKVNYPYDSNRCHQVAEEFKEVTQAAGRTGVICIGGGKKNEKKFLQCLYSQTHISGTRGVAIGRNIYQRKLEEAVRMANAISAIALYNYSAEDAYDIFTGKKELNIK
jgi:fructose-bisphosphate aldolase/6-deoxy-5-ketofructose 1-phosphate synthase